MDLIALIAMLTSDQGTKNAAYGLRDIGYGLLTDHVTSELHKRTFINRNLFSNCY